MVQAVDSTVYYSRIGDRHLGYMKKLHRSCAPALSPGARHEDQPREHRALRPRARQGLTLIHFLAQLKPCLTHKNTLHTLNDP